MSLVSIINGRGFPVIISDRAISVQTELFNIMLPNTSRDTWYSTPVVEFRVKSIIIKNILCVAFVGRVIEIEEAKAEIQDYFLHRNINKESLNNLIAEKGYLYSKNIAILFILGGPEFLDNKALVFGTGNWKRENSRENLDITSAGSGVETWVSNLIKFAPYVSDVIPSPTSYKQRALFHCMMFIRHERYNMDNLLDGWGGGFDIVYYENGGFKRMDNVAYVFLSVDVEDIEQIRLVSAIHNSYLDENVIVRYFSSLNYKLHLIRQFGDSLPVEEPLPFCVTEEAITCIHIYRGGEYWEDIIVMYHDENQNAEPVFYFDFHDGDFGLRFGKEYLSGVKESIVSFIDS